MPNQDYSASLTWTQDWTAHLAANGNAFTISAASASCTTPGVTASGTTVTGAGKSVTFKVAQTGLTTPQTVSVTVHVTMSNGDIDERDFAIRFTNT